MPSRMWQDRALAKALLVIASDGKVNADEAEAFKNVVKRLGSLKAIIDALQVYAEKHNL